MTRPLYDDRARIYDRLFADPVESWVEVVVRHVPPPAALLDAGCGTGRHAEALAASGFDLTLADGARGMIEQAAARLPGAPAHLTDLATMALGVRFDAIACRGVLNDVVGDEARQAVLDRFAEHLRPGGTLLLDVRELEATRERYAAGRALRHEAFASDGRMDGDLVRVRERYDGTESDVVIRPWSREEAADRLAAAGFADWRFETSPGRADRLLAVARR